METVSLETLNANLLALTKVVEEMKEQFEDCFLTAEEAAGLDKSLGELERGEVISLEDLEAELN